MSYRMGKKHELTERYRISAILLGAKYEDNILDVGCGNGSLLSALPRKMRVGVDINRILLKFAKSSLQNVDFILSSATNLPFRDASFDRVSLVEVLQYFPTAREASSALSEASRVLRLNGTFVMCFPKMSFANTVLYIGSHCNKIKRSPYHFYIVDKIVKMLMSKNLDVKAVSQGGDPIIMSLIVALDSGLKQWIPQLKPIINFLRRINNLKYPNSQGFELFIKANKSETRC